MRLRFAFLCGYAVELPSRTHLASEIFDQFTAMRTPEGTYVIVPHTMFVVVEDSSISAPRHLMGFVLRDADGGKVHETELGFNIGNTGRPDPGKPKAATVVIRVAMPIQITDPGSFEWELSVDGERIGSIPFTVAEPEPSPVG